MKIISVDPGYGRIGFAVLDKSNGIDSLLFSECFETSSDEETPERLACIRTRVKELIKEFHPEAMAIEKLFFAKNQKTALAVSEARGVITSQAAEDSIPVFEYSPMDVKIAVTGYGRAEKNQVKEMVERILRMEKKKRKDDEYDAIAVGLAHLASIKVLASSKTI